MGQFLKCGFATFVGLILFSLIGFMLILGLVALGNRHLF